jgi:hypothetical protein
MTDTTDVSTEHAASPQHPSSRLNQALAWVGIVAGGLFIVAGIFLSGFALSWSEHMHMGGGHPAMAHASKDCCADMKHGDMKPGDHEMKPGAMQGMMSPEHGH